MGLCGDTWRRSIWRVCFTIAFDLYKTVFVSKPYLVRLLPYDLVNVLIYTSFLVNFYSYHFCTFKAFLSTTFAVVNDATVQTGSVFCATEWSWQSTETQRKQWQWRLSIWVDIQVLKRILERRWVNLRKLVMLCS